MTDKEKVVSFEEAVNQVQVAFSRLALMHLAFSKVLVEQFGEEEGKDLIVKSIMEYGRKIEEYSKHTVQNLPFFGIHGKYIYQGKEFFDTRDVFTNVSDLELSSLEIYDCSLAKVFQALNEEDLGKLYCYVDAASSMASDPTEKTIHTKCVLCEDNYCQMKNEKTTEKEQKDFEKSNKEWKNIDPILL